jgi:uncharacterized protein
MKILLFIVSVLLIWWILRLLRGPSASMAGKSGPRVENMVACARCGLHIPENEAVSRQGRFYCSEEHAREKRS